MKWSLEIHRMKAICKLGGIRVNCHNLNVIQLGEMEIVRFHENGVGPLGYHLLQQKLDIFPNLKSILYNYKYDQF